MTPHETLDGWLRPRRGETEPLPDDHWTETTDPDDRGHKEDAP